MHFNWTITGDGIATFLTAVVALVAAGIAYSGVKKQIAAEKTARDVEMERQKRVLATALLFEIDDRYQNFLKGLMETLDSHTQAMLPKAYPPSHFSFTVYKALAGRLGELGERTAGQVVGLYSFMGDIAADCEQYVSLKNQACNGKDVSGDTLAKAREIVRGLKNALPLCISQAHSTCNALCDEAKLPFKPETVRIASVGFVELNLRVEQIKKEMD